MNTRISQRIRQLAPSATLAVAEKARALRDTGVSVVSFGAGEPDFPSPGHVCEAAIAAIRAGDTKYPAPVSGINALRDAVVSYLRSHSRVEYARDQICVSVGAKDSLYLAFMTLLDSGDEVIVPAPYWVSYPDQVALAGGSCVFVQCTPQAGLKLTPAQLAAAITPRTRALVMNSPCNPTGAVYSRGELAALGEVLRGTDVVAISDEIYHRLTYTGQEQACFASVPGMQERTLVVNGFSKSFAMTGWRLGYAAGPRWIIDGMAKLQGQTTSGPTSFVQTAAVQALLGNQDDVEHMREAYERRGTKMHAALAALPGVTCLKPQGAFYCFPDVSATFSHLGVRDADGFADAALERAHVAVVSGTPFGSRTHVRLSYATSDEQLDEGLRRLAKMLA